MKSKKDVVKAKGAMDASLLSQLTLSDVESITLENGDDTVTIKVLVPVADGAFAEYEEAIVLDDHVPTPVHEIAQRFAQAVLSSLKSRMSREREVPCATCLGACCYKYDEVRITHEDVDRLHQGLGNRAKEGYYLYESGPRFTGYVGALRKMKRKINGQEVDAACVYLRGDGCSIYEHRPTVCREYSPWTCTDTYEVDPAKVDKRVRLRVLT